jgi:hypothetical protein
MARRLVVALKGTGFNKVQIVLEDGTPVEAEEGEDEEMDGDVQADADETEDAEAQANTAAATPDGGNGAQPTTGAAPGDATAQPADPAQPAAAGDATQPAAAGDATQPATDTSAQPAAPTQAAQPTSPAAQPAAGLDAASLTADLTALVKQMIQVIAADPTKKAALAELATDAQAGIRSGDLAQAAAAIDVLREALGGAGGQGATPAPAAATGPAQDAATPASNGATQPAATPAPNGASQPAATPASNGATQPAAPNGGAGQQTAVAPSPQIAKARMAWVATRQKVEGDLGKLHSAFGDAFKGHAQEDQINKAFRERVETVLNTLDGQLADTLDSVNNAKDANERAQLVQQAQALLQKYQQHVASDPTIAALDNNPFVPLAVARTVGATIDALSRSLR